MSVTVGTPNCSSAKAFRLQHRQERLVADQALQRPAGFLGDALGHRIGFRVDGRSIERVLAVHDAQEACRLFERLRSHARDFLQLRARLERGRARRDR